MSIKGLKKDQYDVVIIGAGIGGLVCGCYLAKAGMKVLIVEKNSKVGGYCQSFERDGFRFDVGVHYLGGLREGTEFNNIFKELRLDKKIEIVRNDITDSVIIKDTEIEISKNLETTIANFQKIFPQERKNIRLFFDTIIKTELKSTYSLKHKYILLKNLFDEFFKEYKLKSVLSIFLGNMGLPSYLVDALSAIAFYKEFIFDGGYYPKGGMQVLPDKLCEVFTENSGEILFNNLVNKITLKGLVKEITLTNREKVFAKNIVWACDPRKLYDSINNIEILNSKFLRIVKKLKPAASAFIVYVMINKKLSYFVSNTKRFRNIWISDTFYIDKYYGDIYNGKIDFSKNVFLCSCPSLIDRTLCNNDKTEILILVTSVPYVNRKFWLANKSLLAEKFLKKLNRIFDGLNKFIKGYNVATPIDLESYTLNTKGSIHGWGSIPKQCKFDLMSYSTPGSRIFLTGQWITQEVGSGGINMVAYTGKRTANIILNTIQK